jgi:hypothetical protein
MRFIAKGAVLALVAVSAMSSACALALCFRPAVALADTAPDVTIDAPSAVTATTAHVTGTVNPNGGPSRTRWHIDYSHDPQGEGWTEAGGGEFTAQESEETNPIPVQANLEGLAANTAYEVRLVALNQGGRVAVFPLEDFQFTFTTLTSPAPTVTAESFSNVGSASASVTAAINAGGLPTTYQVEYGPTTAYGSSSPAASAGTAETNVSVVTELSGLQPLARYHVRVVAVNALGATPGADFVLTTLPSGSSSLPDRRAFEMVTPQLNEDADVYEPFSGAASEKLSTELPFQASADGNAVTYAGSPTAGGNGSSGLGFGNQYLATRSATAGWTQTIIQPPGFATPRYAAFSPDLSRAILCSRESLASSAPARYNDLYARTNANGIYHPLSTVTPPNRPPFEFESFGTKEAGNGCRLAFAGASGDFEHLLFLANAALTPDAPEGSPAENNLYDSVNGHLALVNVLPNGQPEASATFGAPSETPTEPSNPPDFSHVISADGSRIVWSDLQAGPNMEHIFMREHATTTVAVSLGPARFWTASVDGRYVFYTEAGVLFRFDADTATRAQLTSPGSAVEGVLGASEDGTVIYFAAGGVLASGAEPLRCEEFERGTPEGSVTEEQEKQGKFVPGVGCNLYLLRVGGSPEFITRLATADGFEARPFGAGGENGGRIGDWQPALGHRTAQVTPDGQHLLFMSRMSLTGYDNTALDEAGERIAVSEVYLYDAGAKNLACVSCNQSGEPPPESVLRSGAVAFIPASLGNTYMRRAISADGSRVFFDSTVPLVPQDRNGQQDVYEWERDGAGSCHESPGCIYLLSGGTNASQSTFVDASETGDDVFIVTRTRLVPQDGNENLDLYDARVDGTRAPSPPVCTGTGCQGVPPAPPTFATPPSATFAGTGNFQPAGLPSSVPAKPKLLTRAQMLSRALGACRKKPRRSRGKCERQARRLYGPRSKSNSHKRGK